MRSFRDTVPFAALTLALTGCEPTLTGFASLPADTFAARPKSGQYIAAANGRSVPFASQPVQGFSAALDNGDGSFLVMSDNGYGRFENSADYHLRAYTVYPDFRTVEGGSGKVAVGAYIEFRDPNRLVPFAIVNEFTQERILTGADFDPESLQRAADGTLWMGDEFGPFLLHFSADGVLLDPPFSLPDFDNTGKQVRAPQNPFSEESNAVRVMNAVRSHAQAAGSTRTPVFSPYHVMLRYDTNGVKSDSDAHYARGKNTPADLAKAASDVFDIASIKAAGYPVVTWTVNDKAQMTELMKAGVNGIISDRPDLLLAAVREFDANGDGTPGDWLTAEGLIDLRKFDAQGHRGGRNLRPENTLPAMEVALDHLMTTLELDTGVTKDGVVILKHDPYIEAQKCRRADGNPYALADEVLIKDLTQAEIQAQFICDNLFRGPEQKNDPALSPVAVSVAKAKGYASAYVMPTLQDVFDLVGAYIAYYETGAGKAHPEARKRVANARLVRFNIETKINPRSDRDNHGKVYKERTVGADAMADAVAKVIVANGLEARADVQSFDFRTLLRIQQRYPAIRTVYLFGDFPIFNGADSDDGTNLQDEAGRNTPWMAGLYWPYRETRLATPFRAQSSGGYEGMAIAPDGRTLYPMLEKPLSGAKERDLLIPQFDTTSKQYTGKYYRYPLDTRGEAIGDFILTGASEGIVIERDNTQGDLKGYKMLNRITLPANNGERVAKAPFIDLMNIANPFGLAPSRQGDVGIGERFAFPFVTIEDVVMLDGHRVVVLNDNNYPFSVGRHVGSKQPDDNEFIVITLPEKLRELRSQYGF